MKQLFFTMLIMLGVGLCALAAEPPRKLTLAECLHIAEQRHPDLAAARGLIAEAQAQVKAARSGLLPHVDVGGSYTRQTYNYAATPGTPPRLVQLFSNGEGLSNAPYYYTGLNLSQTLFDFGQTKGQVRRAEADYAAAQQNLQRVDDLVYLNVRQAYYGVLAAEEILQARKEAAASQQKHLDQVTAFHEVGTRPKIDVTQQSVALASAQLDLRQAEENLDVARAALATAMGIPIEQAPEPVNNLGEARDPGSLEALMTEAEHHRPDIAGLRDRIYAAQADLIVARSAFRPNLSLASFFNYRSLQLPLIYNWSLGSIVAQGLFEGGARHAHLAAAQAEEDVARANLDSSVQKVRQEVYTDYADLQVAKDKIALSQKAEAEAKENLELAEGRYQAGYGNIIELTDAQYLFTNSQVQTIVSRYDYQTAAASLDVAVGRTPPQ